MMDEATLLHSSDRVLVGTVTAIESAAAPDGGLYTYVHVLPDRIIKGGGGRDPIVVREPGGTFGNREEVIFGVPEFWVGERSLLFLSRNPDGSLQTNSFSMGKYTVGVNAAGQSTAMRNLGDGTSVLDPRTGRIAESAPEHRRLLPFVKRLRQLARAEQPVGYPRPTSPTPPELAAVITEVHENFTLLGGPARWFEPDSGQAVNYFIDSTGDAKLGFAVSRTAADQAFAAWTNVPTSNLILQDGGTTSPIKLNDCNNTTTRIVFNDPFNEITDPANCGGILATAGYCIGAGSTVVNGTTFSRITVGRLMVNNGWGGCSSWTACNLAEVLTHEVGHTIGFGHSSNDPNEPDPVLKAATMYFQIHFDGRCAGLKSDDIAALNFAYPQTGTSIPTATPTNTPRPTSTSTRTPTRTFTNPPTPTSTPLPSSTPIPSSTPTVTATRTLTWTPTPSPTVTPPPTSTATLAPGSLTLGGRITYYSNAQPVAAANIQVLGAANAAAQTDSGGQFAAGGLGTNTIEIVPQKRGDLGPAISALDASYILQFVTGLRALSADQQLACDVTGNGTLSALDAALILQYNVGMLTSFPASQTCGSDWLFVPAPAAAANQQSITPLMVTGSCQQGAIVYQPLAESASGQDFHAMVFGDCTGNWLPSTVGAAANDQARAPAALRIGQTRPEQHGRWVRAPIFVQPPGGVTALDIEVQYDPASLTLVRVRPVGSARHALIAANPRTPGLLVVSLASSEPLQAGAALLLQFDPRDSHRTRSALRLRRATVGER